MWGNKRRRIGAMAATILAFAAIGPAFAGDTRPMIGDIAPDVTLFNQYGEEITLSEVWAAGPVILYFYPKDFTPTCTAQALDFRDSGPELQAGELTVLGVSINTVGSHRRFASAYNLDFDLLSDVNARAAEAFGVRKSMQGFAIARRSTFLIDQGGEVVWIWDPADPREHVDTVLSEAKRLQLGAFAKR